MSAAIHRRLDNLMAARARHELRRGAGTVIDDVRAALEEVDGKADLDMPPGESLFDVCVRRLQSVDGWNLAALPGDTDDERGTNADLIAQGKLTVSDDARHAARHWIGMWEGI